MLFMLWLTVRLLTRRLVFPNGDDGTKDLEILVLRHQLRVLRRKTGRPKFTAADRVLLAAASRVRARASGRCCDATALVRRRDAPARAGRSFFERKLRGSWRATCSRWRRC